MKPSARIKKSNGRALHHDNTSSSPRFSKQKELCKRNEYPGFHRNASVSVDEIAHDSTLVKVSSVDDLGESDIERFEDAEGDTNDTEEIDDAEEENKEATLFSVKEVTEGVAEEEDSNDDERHASDETDQQNSIKGFASAFRTIMSRDIMEAKTPILLEHPEIGMALKEEKVKAKLQRDIIGKRRLLRDMPHVLPNALKKDYERSLRKVAHSGVLKLFNTLIEYRQGTPDDDEDPTDYQEDAKRLKGSKGEDASAKRRFIKILRKPMLIKETAQKIDI